MVNWNNQIAWLLFGWATTNTNTHLVNHQITEIHKDFLPILEKNVQYLLLCELDMSAYHNGLIKKFIILSIKVKQVLSKHETAIELFIPISKLS